MIKYIFDYSKTAVLTLLLLVTATGAIASVTTASAQTDLGDPFFQESGRITNQEEIGPNKTQISYSGNGTMKGDIEVSNIGEFVSISKGKNLTYGQGQGVIKTTDGVESANYTIIGVGNVTQEGKPVLLGAAAYSTNSTGKLAFLNNILGIYKVELGETGSFVSNEWQWK